MVEGFSSVAYLIYYYCRELSHIVLVHYREVKVTPYSFFFLISKVTPYSFTVLPLINVYPISHKWVNCKNNIVLYGIIILIISLVFK